MTIKFGCTVWFVWDTVLWPLGTEKHHKQYLQDIGIIKIGRLLCDDGNQSWLECKGIETTTTYDHAKRSLSFTRPIQRHKKEYIGNAAVHGQMATVFAKLSLLIKRIMESV